jgi:hypothetical protein
MTSQVVSAQQQTQFKKRFARFLFTTLTPVSRLGSPELNAALAVPVAYASRCKAAGSRVFNEAYSNAVHEVMSGIAQLALVCITMDGWKKRAWCPSDHHCNASA